MFQNYCETTCEGYTLPGRWDQSSWSISGTGNVCSDGGYQHNLGSWIASFEFAAADEATAVLSKVADASLNVKGGLSTASTTTCAGQKMQMKKNKSNGRVEGDLEPKSFYEISYQNTRPTLPHVG